MALSFAGEKSCSEKTYFMYKPAAQSLCIVPFSFASQVGVNLKTPRYPIWLVCSESHFSVLFGLEQSVLTHRDGFDLYYYDGLANQQEEIRLTVCT